MNKKIHVILDAVKNVGPTALAQLMNQVVVMATQILMVPALISAWGVAGFGTWMALVAIPQYMSISDFGFTSTAKSDMSIRARRGDVIGAQMTSSSVASLLIMVFVMLSLVYFPLLFSIDLVDILNLSQIDNTGAIIILAAGFFNIVCFQAFLFLAAILRAAGKPTMEVLLNSIFRALDTLVIVVVAINGGDLVASGIAWAAVRFCTTMGLAVFVFAKFKHLSPRYKHVSFQRIKDLARPSISFMTVPLANALLIQGTTILISSTLGAVAVAIYVVSRTVARLGVSGANVLNFAFTPQYSYLVGDKSFVRLRQFFKVHIRLVLVVVTLYILTVAIAGKYFVELLSRNEVAFAPHVFYALVAASVFEMLWSPFFSFGAAQNKVGRLSFGVLFMSIGSVLLSIILIQPYAVNGPAYSLMALQMFMLVYSILWWRFSKDTLFDVT